MPDRKHLVEACRASTPRLAKALTPRVTNFIPHRPTPKQAAFLLLTCEEALFGGSAGGGKTDALLMAALQFVDVPHYAALILRRTYADLALPGALMDRAREWLYGSSARWNQDTKTWTFPSGATLSFGYLENEQDRFRYQGSEFQFVAFDELTQFPESSYRYLFSRLRRLSGVEIPLRMRAASNPGGMGHDWVKLRFIDGKTATRIFIPSRLMDNPFLDQAGYLKSLDHLDPITRRQLLEGDWSARFPGSIFKREWFSIVEETPKVPLAGRVRSWDLAASVSEDAKRTAGVRMTKTRDGMYIVEHVVAGKWTPGDRDKTILSTARSDGHGTRVIIEQEPGSGGIAQVDSLIKLLGGYSVEGIRATGDKAVRAAPFASQAEAGNVKLLNGEWNLRFLDELESFPEGSYVDQTDAAAAALTYLAPKQGYSILDILPTKEEVDEQRRKREIWDGFQLRGNPFEDYRRSSDDYGTSVWDRFFIGPQ